MNAIDINRLPQDVQTSVRESLTAYPVAYIERENGRYKHIGGLSLDTRVKAPDFKTFEIKNTDLYTQEEIVGHIKKLNETPESSWY